MFILYVQKWTESEAGWGQRPDGYSLHISRDERDRVAKTSPIGSSECYSFPTGDAYPTVVSEQQYNDVKSKGTVWCFDRNYPKPL
jgi:hypothetical protein